MTEKKDEVQEEGLINELDNLLEEEATPEESSPSNEEETVEEEDKPSQEGDNIPDEKQIPFHEHPRFKEVIEEKNALKSELEELSKFKDEVSKKFSQEDEEEMPAWAVEMYGDDKERWKKINHWEQKKLEEAESRVLEKVRAEQSDLQKRQELANQTIEKEIDSMKAEGLKFDKNELFKTAMDWELVGKDGVNYDLRKAHKILELQKGKSEATQQKKKLAANSSSASSETNVEKPLTSADIARKRIW